jgi:hypothetical protein
VAKRKRKQVPKRDFTDIELNIIPFIDVFSLLNTFLLFSAVFVATGIIEVQIPFLSSAPPPKEDLERSISVKVDLSKDKIECITSWSPGPENEQKWSFSNNKDGMKELHARLVQIRKENPTSDKVTFFTEDDVIWENISGVLDSIKLREEADPVFNSPPVDGKPGAPDRENLFPKVVMGSVIL